MRILLKQWFAGIILAGAAGSANFADEQAAPLRAGAAAVDITPQRLPVSMTGSFQDRQATAALDPLHARCLVLDNGQTQAAIVVCDSCLITRDIFDAAKQEAARRTGIPVDSMLMSATHTHTAPTAVPLAQCRPDPEYVAFLTRRIADAVIAAHGRLSPARIGWSSVEEPREVGNRRWFVKPETLAANPFGRTDDRVRTNPPAGSAALVRPAGPVDPEVFVLAVESADGAPLAVLANYGLHYVGGIPGGQLSADYFGEFARRIGQRLNAPPSFVGMMSNGASGDVNNYQFRDAPRPAAPLVRMREVADRLADAAHQSVRAMQFVDRTNLAVRVQSLTLGVRRPNPHEVERAQSLLAKAENPQRLNTEELYAQETLRLAERPPTVTIPMQVLRVGDVGVVAIPCEVFAEIGLEIKRRSPLAATFVVGLANDYHGYLPTPEQHALGGYETWRSGWSYLEEDASTKITAVALDLLRQVADEGR